MHGGTGIEGACRETGREAGRKAGRGREPKKQAEGQVERQSGRWRGRQRGRRIHRMRGRCKGNTLVNSGELNGNVNAREQNANLKWEPPRNTMGKSLISMSTLLINYQYHSVFLLTIIHAPLLITGHNNTYIIMLALWHAQLHLSN